MPNYLYECKTITCVVSTIEKNLPMSECRATQCCEACGEKLVKVITAPALGGMDKQGSSTSGDGNIARLL